MKREMVGLLIREGSKLLSETLKLRILRVRRPVLEYTEEQPTKEAAPAEPSGIKAEATSIEAGCVPCALGHVGTCAGLLSEATRFARDDGMNNNVTIDRINKCLIELNTMERGDLTEAKIRVLPDWEKAVAEDTLKASRALRHKIEGIRTVDNLSEVTAEIQSVQGNIVQRWYGEKLKGEPPPDAA